MEYQSFGRPQRPKGASIKQVLKVILVLAVCTWLLYQIKYTRNKTENYGGQTKHVAAYEATSLGRKGMPLRLDEEKDLPYASNGDSVGEAKGSSGGRGDVSDGAKEDKAEEEFGHSNEKFRTNEDKKVVTDPEFGHSNEKFRTNEGKKVVTDPESQPKVSSKNIHKDSSKEKSGEGYLKSRVSESGNNDHGNEKYPKRAVINEIKSNDKEKEVQLKEELPNDVHIGKNAMSHFSVKEKDEDEDPRIQEKETKVQINMVESTADAGLIEEMHEVQSFHDENGIPPDGSETETMVGHVHMLHEENIANVSKEDWPEKINIYEGTSGEDNDVEMNLEGSKNAIATSRL